MSLVIKGGTIVAADRTYKADVLVEGEKIKAIGQGLKGDRSLDADGLLRDAGRHRPAHPSRNALHGHHIPPTITRAAPRRRCPAARRWSSISASPTATSR